MNQNDLTLEFLRQFGSITPMEAKDEFGCMRLAARIADLKKDGHRITKTMESGRNRRGDIVRYARYTLEDTQ